MLKKLLKYDLLFNVKLLLVFYSLTLFFAVLTRIFFSFENSLALNILAQIFSGTTISMMLNCLINNIMRLWVRFKTNLYGDESYLTHTLPITKSTQYISKFLSALISLFATIAVIVLAVIIAYCSKENLEFINNLFSAFGDLLNTSPLLLAVGLGMILFLEFLSAIQCGYTGIILGHRYNNHKVLLSIIIGFVSYMATQTIVVLTALIAGFIDSDIMTIFKTNKITDFSVVITVSILTIIVYAALIVAGFLLNIKLLNKGVNVD